MAVSKKFTKQSFRTWLEGYTPKTKVGYRSGKTPVDKYMEAQGILHSELPRWAQNFVDELTYTSNANSVSAGAALNTLERVK
jgi:hypothetical protein